MELTNFLKQLYQEGVVTVLGRLEKFSTKDLLESAIILQQVYERVTLALPYNAPVLHPEAALWAAEYLYRSTELILRRDIAPQDIQRYLSIFPFKKNASIALSVDLTLSYLPDLWNFAKGLAPNDPLMPHLKAVATQFPFSSVGLEIENGADHSSIWANSCLKTAYLDRIIEKKDKKRVKQFQLEEKIKEVVGAYEKDFWTF